MTTLIVNIAAERFGTKVSKPAPSAYAPSHRARKIQCLREELRLLKRQYKSAGEVERAGLVDLRAILRKQLLTLQRAEFHRRRRKERARKRAAFLANPFKLTKQLLGQKRAGCLTCSKDAINDHLKATYSESIREQPLDPCDALITQPEPASDFDLKEPRLREVEEVVRRARSSSAPGPSECPTRCIRTAQSYYIGFGGFWRWFGGEGRSPSHGGMLKGVCIPKEEKSENIDQFRVISLLSVESKSSSASWLRGSPTSCWA